MTKKLPFDQRVAKIYGDANRMCNELDGLIMDMGMELAGKPYVKDFVVLGKLAEMFEQACTTRRQADDLTKEVKKLNGKPYKFDEFNTRFKWRKAYKKERYRLIDTKYKEEVAEIYFDKHHKTWRTKGQSGGSMPLSSAKSMAEFRVKRAGYY